MPAAVAAYAATGSVDDARVQQREIDGTYTADMTDPDNGISGIAARKVWRSIPAQLLRSSVMQALASNDLQTYYWTPPSSWKTTGELDFLLQTDRMEVVPVEVKSARNVRARTLASFLEKTGTPCAYLLSENDFSRASTESGSELRCLPLYAAHCIGKGCVKAEF